MKSHQEMDWHRLVRYLAGEYAPDEEKELQAWIVDDEERAQRMDELKQIWDATKRPVPPRDVKGAWQELREELHRGDLQQNAPGTTQRTSSGEERTRPRSREADTTARRSRNRWQLFFRVAAVGVVVAATALLTALLLKDVKLAPFSAETKVFTTEKGQQTILRLSDGSKVHLNVDSRLALVEGFDTGRREVRLEGEAYFEVAGDADRPFIVRSKRGTAEVLGTAFDVKAYADDQEMQVTVAEGKVALRGEKSAPQDTVLLRARHLGTISSRHIQVVREEIDLSKQLAWTKGQIVFRDASFDEVIRKLERWHDLRIETRVAPETVDRFNATFHDESSDVILKAVAAALDLQYERNGKTVVFYRQG